LTFPIFLGSLLLSLDGFGNVLYWLHHDHGSRWKTVVFQAERAIRGFLGLLLPYLVSVLNVFMLQLGGVTIFLEGLINIYIWRGDRRWHQVGRIIRSIGGLLFAVMI
jgi:hypothetical protein